LPLATCLIHNTSLTSTVSARDIRITTTTLIIAALIILLAYVIRGISGFGSGLIAIPLLAHFLPLQFVVPLILVTDFSASLLMGGGTHRHARWREIHWLLPTGALGLVLGVSLLVNLPKQPLLITLGLFVLAFGVRNIFNIHGDKRISRWWALPAGLIGGTVSALFGTGGPPYVIYLSHRLREKSELRATFTGLFLIEGALRVTAYLIAGLLLQDGMLWALAGALPLMALGLYAGHRVHMGISQTQMLRIIGSLLLVSGTSLLWKAWA
jgi:hypothetical protein